MLTIRLSNGLESYVDDQDFSYLSQLTWRPLRSGNLVYACTWTEGRTIAMHRLILNAPKGMVVDHINHNPLDNRRENLRLCTQRENVANQRKLKGKNRFKGVYPKAGKYQALITVNYKQIALGTFPNEEDAARAYDMAAVKLHGAYACLNFASSEVA